MDIVNFIAYRRTGKDCLAKALMQRDRTDLANLGWKVYASPVRPPFKLQFRPAIRLALAYSLKEDLCDELGVSRDYFYSGQLDEDKDKPREECELTVKEGLERIGFPRVREAMIERSRFHRETFGTDYYVKRILVKIDQANKAGQTVLLTDVRSYPDLQPGPIIRLFRSEVEIPPADDMSERKMDSCAADLALCRSDDDLTKLIFLQPQYEGYQYQGELSDLVEFV